MDLVEFYSRILFDSEKYRNSFRQKCQVSISDGLTSIVLK